MHARNSHSLIISSLLISQTINPGSYQVIALLGAVKDLKLTRRQSS